MKTPEEYFQDKVEVPDENARGGLTPNEQAFVNKYLGMEEKALDKVRRYDPSGDEAVPGFGPPATEAAPAEPEEEAVDHEAIMRSMDEVQLVSFYLGNQEFALPITAIQEVNRYIEPTRLPSAPPFMEGIINLRGRVTPLLHLRSMLRVGADEADDRFIIVCRHKGLQIGLIITAVHTMYRAPQSDLEWNIEASVGISADFQCGLMKKDGKLVNILSIDKIVDRVLAS